MNYLSGFFLVNLSVISANFRHFDIIHSSKTINTIGRHVPNVLVNPSFGFLQIFYCNLEANLHVIFEWCNTGWTSREEATADAIITGAKKPKVLGSATPWAEIFEVKVNADSWIYTLQVLYYGKYTFNFVELHSNARIYNDQ